MNPIVLALLLTIFIIIGSSIYLWCVAYLFSILNKKFFYPGKGEVSPRLVFQITSKYCPPTIQRSIDSIIQSCCELGLNDYEVWVVTDNPIPAIPASSMIRAIMVPEDFTNKARHKARALEYARTIRMCENYDGWIFFLDEENWVTRQTINAITSFIVHGNTRIASGPLLFAKSNSMLAWLADSIRSAQCRICHLGHTLGQWPVHGENLLIHSEIEKEVGWKYDSLLEDVLFWASARRRGYRTGWHGGQLYSTSPDNLFDFIIQRRRWFRGMLQVISNRNIEVKYRVLELYLLSCGLLGVFFIGGTIANLFSCFLPQSFSYLFLYPALILFSAAYFTGCNGDYRHKLLAVLLCWFSVLFESVAAWLSFILPPKGFDIIKKA